MGLFPAGMVETRRPQMARARQYYDGQAPPQLRRRANQPDDNLPLPLPRIIIDKGAAFLFGRDVGTQVLLDGAEGIQSWLDEVWRRNKRGLFLQKLAINGGIYGHAFVRILPGNPYPRLINLDPQLVDVECAEDDIEAVCRYAITTPGHDDEMPRRVLIENVTANVDVFEDPTPAPQWVISDQQYRGDALNGTGDWITVRQTPWPYPFPPIADCQNIPRPNDFWGESDLPPDVLALIDGINRVSSHFGKIVRLFSHPKVWTRGMGAQRLDLSTDAIIHLPSETAELRVLETPADLPSILALLEKLLSLNAFATRIPLIAMGEPDALGALSGVSLQIRYQPLLEKTEAKRLTYGDLLVELDRRLLAMGGFGDMVLTQQVWPDILPRDAVQERQALLLEQQLGTTSRQTMAAMLGLDYQQEQRRLAQEAQIATPIVAATVATKPSGTVSAAPPNEHPTTEQGRQLLNSAFSTLMDRAMAPPTTS